MRWWSLFIIALFLIICFFPLKALPDDCNKAIMLYEKAMASGDLKEKEGLYKKALSIPCDNQGYRAYFHNNLADTYGKGKRYPEAETEYKKAMELDPGFLIPYISLGDLYSEVGRTEDADASYSEYLHRYLLKICKKIVDSTTPEGQARSIKAVPSATVYFGSNEEILDMEAQKRLEAFHARIRQDEFMNYRLKIIGHTCPIDKERHNQGLSEKRAEAAKQWLVEHGYPSGDIQVKGMGDREPVSENGTEGKNRRVEIRIAGCILSDLTHYPKWKKGIDLLEQGDRHCETERYEEAVNFFKEAEGLFAQVRLQDGRAAALGSLFLVYGRSKDTANADKYLNEFNSMMEKLPFDCSGSKD